MLDDLHGGVVPTVLRIRAGLPALKLSIRSPPRVFNLVTVTAVFLAPMIIGSPLVATAGSTAITTATTNPPSSALKKCDLEPDTMPSLDDGYPQVQQPGPVRQRRRSRPGTPREADPLRPGLCGMVAGN